MFTPDILNRFLKPHQIWKIQHQKRNFKFLINHERSIEDYWESIEKSVSLTTVQSKKIKADWSRPGIFSSWTPGYFLPTLIFRWIWTRTGFQLDLNGDTFSSNYGVNCIRQIVSIYIYHIFRLGASCRVCYATLKLIFELLFY